MKSNTKREHKKYPEVFAEIANLAGITNFDYEECEKILRKIGANDMLIIRWDMFQAIIEWNSDNEIVEMHFALRR